MNQTDMLALWSASKVARRKFYRLAVPASCEFEYNHPHGGYAYVKFECQPADELHFTSTAAWPETLSQRYVQSLKNDITASIVDTLLVDPQPYIGCALILTNIKWDEVKSNQMAFYAATRGAMNLLTQRQWILFPQT